MKHLFAFIALTVLSCVASAAGQDIKQQTSYVACFILYGDEGKPTEVTPVAKVSMPLLPLGAKSPNMQFMLSSELQGYLLSKEVRFYKSGCLDDDNKGDPELVRKKISLVLGNSGYGHVERKQLKADEFWVSFLDYVYSRHARVHPSIKRESYSYQIVK